MKAISYKPKDPRSSINLKQKKKIFKKRSKTNIIINLKKHIQ